MHARAGNIDAKAIMRGPLSHERFADLRNADHSSRPGAGAGTGPKLQSGCTRDIHPPTFEVERRMMME